MSISDSSCPVSTEIYKKTRGYAIKMKLLHQIAEDCTIGFVEWSLFRGGRILKSCKQNSNCEACIKKCFKNFVFRFYLIQKRKNHYEVNISSLPYANEYEWDHSDSKFTPEDTLIFMYYREKLIFAIRNLSPIQQMVIVQHHFNGDSFESLSMTTGKSVGAIKVILHRARKRLRFLLEHMDLSKEEVDEYLSLFSISRQYDVQSSPMCQYKMRQPSCQNYTTRQGDLHHESQTSRINKE